KSFDIEKIMIERYGDGGNTDISKGLSPFPLRKPAGLAILEVTERCNLTCPMCYAYSSPAERDYSLEEIETRLDQLIAVEGKGISLQISGGEPSVRKDLDKIAAMVKRKGFGQLEMVSNGIRLAREPDFAEKLVEWGFTSVYLQFDSTRPDDIFKLRGEDLWDVRVKAIAALERVKLHSTLAFSLLKYTKEGYKPIAPNFTLKEFMEVIGPRPNMTLRMLTRGRAAVLPQIVSNIGGSLKLMKTLWPHIGTDASFWTSRKTLTLFVKPFMDESDIDMSRIERCCFHNASPRGVMSFCALNAKMRPAQPHAQESAFMPLPTRRAKQQQAVAH